MKFDVVLMVRVSNTEYVRVTVGNYTSLSEANEHTAWANARCRRADYKYWTVQVS